MKTAADLEIGLHLYDDDHYSVELRFSHPGSDADVRRGAQQIQFPLDDLRARQVDPAAYGYLLSETLFANDDVRDLFSQARAVTQSEGMPLRLRLNIGPTALELHGLRWETLRDAQDGSSLLTSDNILFSRYVDSQDMRGVGRLRRDQLRALVVIANPHDLGEYKLGGVPFDPVPVEAERARVAEGLAEMAVTWLASGGSATIQNIIWHLRDGYDILYLVCHGAIVEGRPRLWLEDEVGKAHVIAAGELVARLRELTQVPRLVVLASCQSGGTGKEGHIGDGGTLAAVGPRLAAAGIPSVLAMQGNVTVATVATFMPVFFRELRRDGQVDRAMAAARSAVLDRLDSWMPVLFMRLRSGRLWYAPGFAGVQNKTDTWTTLRDTILKGRCTPILGHGLTEPMFGSRREIAQRWADTWSFPMAPHEREDLPQVAQYLAANRGLRFPRESLLEYLLQTLNTNDAAQPGKVVGASHEELVEAVSDRLKELGEQRRQDDPDEPHAVLARFPIPVYITTNPDDLLTDALRAEGKEPRIELCPWHSRRGMRWPKSVFRIDRAYRPSPQQPLVYHLFGHFSNVDSLVITEDDYFDFLIGVSSNQRAIPDLVISALVNNPLLFLGFGIDDWSFRILFRSIVGRGGSALLENYAHVAAQINPEEGRILEPDGARAYLEKEFGRAKISIYWGTAEDFVRELATWVGDANKVRAGVAVGEGW